MRTDPKPNEVWLTKHGNLVLVVEHPMNEVACKLGFVWYDAIDRTMSFSPLYNQLKEKTELSIKEWGEAMDRARGALITLNINVTEATEVDDNA